MPSGVESKNRPDNAAAATWPAVPRVARVMGVPAAPPPSENATGRKNMLQLIQLRWMAVVGQVVTIMGVHFLFGISFPFTLMAGVLALLVALNVASLLRLRRHSDVSNGELFVAMLLDIAALTAQLYLSGGVTNPFISIYLLQLTMSAVLLEAWSTWAMVAIAAGCFALLTVFYRPIAFPNEGPSQLFEMHVEGTLICFLLDAALLVVFVTRITSNLRARDAHLADLRQQAAEEDHIVRMGLLASGTAHELGTPLSTLSVILNDWRRMPALTSDPEMLNEIDEMEDEVRRCKTIVTGILLSAGEARGEAPVVTTVKTFLDSVIAEWRATHAATELAYDNAFGEDLPIISDTGLRQIIFNVLDNAAEASPRWVGFSAAKHEDALVLWVRDAGPGFAAEMLANFGKPYNSSKGRPAGGLGLFLVVNIVRKLGGSVAARNRPGLGAMVTLTLPLAAFEIGAADAG
jgi:two-component system, sensor histidine kinase RegB